MKKIGVILVVALFALALLASCKTAENCPAYSDAAQTPVEVEEVA